MRWKQRIDFGSRAFIAGLAISIAAHAALWFGWDGFEVEGRKASRAVMVARLLRPPAGELPDATLPAREQAPSAGAVPEAAEERGRPEESATEAVSPAAEVPGAEEAPLKGSAQEAPAETAIPEGAAKEAGEPPPASPPIPSSTTRASGEPPEEVAGGAGRAAPKSPASGAGADDGRPSARGDGGGPPAAELLPDAPGELLLSAIRDRIDAVKRYPLLARRRGWEGDVLVELRLGGGGQLEEVKVLREPEHAILLRETLAAVRRAAPYPPYEGRVHIPVRYRLQEK